MALPQIIQSSAYDDLMNEIELCKTNYDLFRVLRLICTDYGGRNFMVSEIPKDDEFNLQDTLIVSNWDPEIIREFDLNYTDNFINLYQSLRNSINPIHLHLPVAISEPDSLAADTERQLQSGPCVFFPVYDRIGRKGMIGFSTLECESDSENRFVNLGFLSNFVFDKFMEIKKDTNITHNSLSDREIQCLNWTALGKTSYEIGIILDISLNTVNHYLHNASKKLNCVNKTHAVAKCVQDGII